MKYKEAQAKLKHAINSQKTIRTSKLAEILQSMNISLKKNNDEMRDTFERRNKR